VQGVDASVKGRTRWGGGVRENVSLSSSFFLLVPSLLIHHLLQGYKVLAACGREDTTPKPGIVRRKNTQTTHYTKEIYACRHDYLHNYYNYTIGLGYGYILFISNI
jgi:hypothetical protein